LRLALLNSPHETQGLLLRDLRGSVPFFSFDSDTQSDLLVVLDEAAGLDAFVDNVA